MNWLLTILVCVLLHCCSSDGINNENRIDKNYFDILIFTQQWPATVCYTWKERSKNNQCILPSPKEVWTIHGIWPTKFHTKGPAHCNDSLNFNIDALKPIEKQLEHFWLNVEKGTPFDQLWRHEWEKHGTCAAQLQQLDTESKYFGQGLVWLQQHSMSSLLSQANILPGGSYDIKEVYKALQKSLGINPAISCVKDHVSGNSYIFEIRICFDKELKLANCDGIVNTAMGREAGWKRSSDLISNCDYNKPVFYPSVVPPTKHDVVTETNYDDKESSFSNIPFVKLYKLLKILQWATL